MTQLTLLRPHTHAGKAFSAGDLIDVPPAAARWLTDHGLAHPAAAPPGAPPAQDDADAGPVATPAMPISKPSPRSKDYK